MSKLFSPITEMPGKSGKSSTASGMTRYAVNKSFAKGGTMSKKFSLTDLFGIGYRRAARGRVSTSPGAGGGGGKKPRRTGGGSGGGPTYSAPLSGLVTKPVGPIARFMGSIAQQAVTVPYRIAEAGVNVGRHFNERRLAGRQRKLKALISQAKTERSAIKDVQTTLKDLENQALGHKAVGRSEGARIGEWVQANPIKAALLVGGGTGTAVGTGKAIFDGVQAINDWANPPADEGPKGYKPNNTYRTSARGIGTMGKGMYKGMGGMCKCGSGMRKGMCKCGGMGKRMTKRAIRKNVPGVYGNDARMRDEMRRSGSAQYRGNPQTTTTASPLEQLYAYVAPRVASAAREAERMGRNAYGGALNYGGQVADLIANERAKGFGPMSGGVTVVTNRNTGATRRVAMPTVQEVYERAKTVGSRPQTGQYADPSAVERALQFVRDFGESNAPTAKPKITGPAVYTTHNRGRMKVKDGEFVPYYQDVDMGTKTPKQQKGTVREDVVYGGGSLGGRGVKPTMQVWDTATMSERGKKWTPQMQAKENFIYDADAKRYKSTTRRDADAITAFETKQRAPVRRAISSSEQTYTKPLLSGYLSNYEKSMKKSVSSMRSAGTRHLVGGYRGGSKLHKAATPTLATRNFRGKYE